MPTEFAFEGDAPKYTVWKIGGEAVDDAVVIRLKDPFAATALYTYCNTIISYLELSEGLLTEDVNQRMLDLADFFHAKAMESEKIKGKRLPD